MNTVVAQPVADRAPRAASLSVGHAVMGVWLEQTQTWLYNQIRYLPANVVSHVYCEATANLDQFPIANLHVLGRAGGWARAWRRVAERLNAPAPPVGLASAVARTGVQVLHSHFGSTGWQNCRLTGRRGIRHVVTFYGLDVNYLPRVGWAARYPELFRRVDRVLCEGPHMATCVQRLGCAADKVRVHRLGVAVDEIAFRPRAWTAGQPLRVLIAASFREKKGVPYALEALAQLRGEVELRITIIGDAGGDAASQAEKRRILEVIERCNLAPQIERLGYQPHERFFAEAYRAHVFLSPSVTAASGDTEGGAPVSLIEIAASGMPIVSTRHCDIPQVIVDGETGLLADERDVSGLVAALRRLVARPEAWPTMLQAGRERVERLFDARKQAAALAETYEELL